MSHDDLAMPRPSCDEPAVQVGARQQSVVVQHLLEVRDEPILRRRHTDGSRRRSGRGCRRRPWRRGLRPPCRAPPRSRLRRCIRSRNSRARRAGTSARRRSPPCSRSNCSPRTSTASVSSPLVRGSSTAVTRSSGRSPRRAPRPDGPRRRGARLYASATAFRTSWNAGMPCRGAGGKYVPPQNGSPSGVRKTVIGHPPWPVSATTASM